MDRKTGTFVDGAKVHTVDFEGKYFKSRGPLNTVRSPQGRPVLVQAGASPAGREFASKYADSIIATASGVEAMKAYRDDIRGRMVTHGRNPNDCKVLFLVAPILGSTGDEALAKKERLISNDDYIQQILISISSITEIDFSKFELDKEPPELTTNAERGSLEKFAQRGSGKTVRELASEGMAQSLQMAGTPGEVADQMAEAMEVIGGDGFLIGPQPLRCNRRYIAEITDGLVPTLQDRGLVRNRYTYDQFRDNLLEF
jgi:alkanesulfonate monooxygenase SsuD/methylene tetrahydromethanopterin reductase-like flavin-dependent oxidoreductase (luciferase family)